MTSPGTRLLVRHLTPRWAAMTRVAAWSIVQGVPSFFSGMLVARAIDKGFLAGRPGAGLAWLGVFAATQVVGAVATRQVYPWLAETIESLRDGLVADVVGGSMARVVSGDRRAGGSSVAQATAQVESVRQLLSSLLSNAQEFVSVVVGALGGLAVLSPTLALIVAPMVLAALAAFVGFVKLLVSRQRAVLLAGEQVSAVAAPVVNGVRDVVASAAQAAAAEAVIEVVEAQAAAQRAFARARASRLLVVALGAQIPLLAVLAASPWLIEHRQATVGTVAGAAVYLANGMEPAFRFLVNAGGTSLISLGAVLGRLAEVCAPTVNTAATLPAATPDGHALDVEGLRFAYSRNSEPVVDDLSITVPEGTHLAVVGPSGIGKSTLANLLSGLVVPQQGWVRLGGVPLEAIREPELRLRVTLIPQEAYVFTGTIRDNLTYLRPYATADQVAEAVAAVGLAETVDRLGGLDAEIPPGGGALSAGERQLVALARAYLSPARVVILDEATCHLDPTAEARAEQAFTARPGTLIVVAHRVSSAMRAERVLLMDGARPVLGTHESLLELGGLYAELVGHWQGVAPIAS